MKRSWGRLGAAVGAVAFLAGSQALLAGSQVGVAAYTTDYNCMHYGAGHPDYPGFETSEARDAHAEANAPTACDWKSGVEYIRWKPRYDPQYGYGWTAIGEFTYKTAEEKCEDSGKYWYYSTCNEKSLSEKECEDKGDKWIEGECKPWPDVMPVVDVIDLKDCPDGFQNDPKDGTCVPIRAEVDQAVEEAGVFVEPVQKNPPPPPPCWSAEALNNCPVGGALRFDAPEYAMVGVPVTMYAYASWRPNANSSAQPTNGTAVIRVDGEDYSGVEFKDGVAKWRFIPETEGMKEFTASGVLFSGLSGANAYIDTVEARTYVLEYDPAAYAKALKKKAVEVGETYTITDPNQARSYLKDRYEWSVSEKSDDVCAVYETKKGAVKAKFNGEGKCTVIWMDKESADEGKYTFIAKK